MSRLNVALGLLAFSFVACGGESTPQSEYPPQSVAPAEEPTGATAPSVGAATADAAAAPSTMGSSTAGETAATPKMEPLTDGEIALISELSNKSEVEQGKVAQKRAKNARVKKFANMMVNDHGKSVQEQTKLLTKAAIQTDESALSSQLASESTTQLNTLNQAEAADFDRVYIDSQVDIHQKTLNTIDTELLPNAKNEDLKALLTKMRGAVEHHLKEARDIQQSLAATGGPGTGPMGATGSGTTGTSAGKAATGTTGSGTTGTGSGTTGSGTTGNKGSTGTGAGPGGGMNTTPKTTP